MKIAITDANIFIDLCYLGWLPQIGQLELEIHTTNYVLNELNEDQVGALAYLGDQHLVVFRLSDNETSSLNEADFPRTFSEADKSVLWYIQTHKINTTIVLSGDKPMQNWCKQQNIEVQSIIWIFDQMIEKKVLPISDVHASLTSLVKFNPHLPQQECEDKLNAIKLRK